MLVVDRRHNVIRGESSLVGDKTNGITDLLLKQRSLDSSRKRRLRRPASLRLALKGSPDTQKVTGYRFLREPAKRRGLVTLRVLVRATTQGIRLLAGQRHPAEVEITSPNLFLVKSTDALVRTQVVLTCVSLNVSPRALSIVNWATEVDHILHPVDSRSNRALITAEQTRVMLMGQQFKGKTHQHIILVSFERHRKMDASGVEPYD
jgi:hypothetical protein